MRFALLVVAACTGLVSAAVTEFPPLSLYTGSGGYTASDTDNLGAFACYGDVSVKDYAAGASLPPAPFGTRACSTRDCLPAEGLRVAVPLFYHACMIFFHISSSAAARKVGVAVITSFGPCSGEEQPTAAFA